MVKVIRTSEDLPGNVPVTLPLPAQVCGPVYCYISMELFGGESGNFHPWLRSFVLTASWNTSIFARMRSQHEVDKGKRLGRRGAMAMGGEIVKYHHWQASRGPVVYKLRNIPGE
jgi:hypothetical protein